jgi:hypothetical protein
MKKKIIKIIESALPQLYDVDGEIISRKMVANKVYDTIPNIEKLDIPPFGTYIPFECSTCYYNQAHKLGCSYDLFSQRVHEEHEAPDNCPLNHHRN